MALSRFFAVFSPHSKQWFERVEMLAPRVEVCPPDGLVLETPARYEPDTLNRLAQMADRDASIGGGSTRTTAILAARFHPGTIVPHGQESRFLAPLPIGALACRTDLDPGLLAVLHNWGVRTLGELAALPEQALVARLGQKGASLRKLALGEDVLPLPGFEPDPEFVESRQLEWTLALLEPLTFLVGGMLTDLCSRLQGQGLAVESLLLTLSLGGRSISERRLKPAFPMQDPRALLSLVRVDLQTTPPQEAVDGIRLQVFPGRPRTVQGSLFHPPAPHPEKLARTLTRLKAVAGEENVGIPRILDTHRPDAVLLEEMSTEPSGTVPNRSRNGSGSRPQSHSGNGSVDGSTRERRLALRRIRPPQPVRLHNEGIVSCAGPWRSSGDWWADGSEAGPWTREEWDIERSDGLVCRVYWDAKICQWFMEGIYD